MGLTMQEIPDHLREAILALARRGKPGHWLRCRCPFPDCAGKKRPNFAIKVDNEGTGYFCPRCGAKGKIFSVSLGLSAKPRYRQCNAGDWRPHRNVPAG